MKVLARGPLVGVHLCGWKGIVVEMGEKDTFAVGSTPGALAEWWESGAIVEVVDHEHVCEDGTAAPLYVRPAE